MELGVHRALQRVDGRGSRRNETDLHCAARFAEMNVRTIFLIVCYVLLWRMEAFAQQASPHSGSAEVLRDATRLLAEHHEDAAATLLEQYIEIHPGDADVLVELAKIREARGNSAAAKELLLQALRVSPNSPPANLILGKMLLAKHRDPEAMDRFETVLASDLHNADARAGELAAVTELAITMREESHPDRALLALQHSRPYLYDDPQLLLELGIQMNELGNAAGSVDVLEAAHKLRPDDLQISYALARAEFSKQDMVAAESGFRAYLEKRPSDASAHFGLGRVLEALQRTDEARAEFQQSIKFQPIQTESYYELGDMELKTGHDAEAEQLFAKVLARDAGHGGALTDMGEIDFRRKDFAGAEQWLSKAEAAAPAYPPAHYYRGLVLARLGRKEESDAELKKATELDHLQHGAPAAKDGASEPNKP
jgi:Flp pilus assembly protein TadD